MVLLTLFVSVCVCLQLCVLAAEEFFTVQRRLSAQECENTAAGAAEPVNCPR